MKLGFVVNYVETEKPHFTSIRLAIEAHNRGHKVYLISVGDLSYDEKECITAKACTVKNSKKYDNNEDYLKDLIEGKCQKINVGDLDVLMLRNDPALEPSERAWARTISLDFGMLAIKKGVIVLNNPGGLSKSRNKIYLEHFPEEIRPKTIITRDRDEIKRFFNENEKIILKPLLGSEGRNVFLAHKKEQPNLNQMIDAVSRDGYVIAQEYLGEADKGDIRLFLMNGEPLIHKGVYAAFKRVKSNGDLRNNISAGGKSRKVKIDKKIKDIINIVRPRLVQDGMFLVGLDIVGNKLLEINVFSPGGLGSLEKVTGINFSEPIIDALERKVEYMKFYKRKFDNNEMATL